MPEWKSWLREHGTRRVGAPLVVLSALLGIGLAVSNATQVACPIPRWSVILLLVSLAGGLLAIAFAADRPPLAFLAASPFLIFTIAKLGLICPQCGAWEQPWSATHRNWRDGQLVTEGRGGASCPVCGYAYANDYLHRGL